MKKKMIFFGVILLLAIVGILIYNIGAEKRGLIKALEFRGYVKGNDGVYRLFELREEGNYVTKINRSYDVNKNYAKSTKVVLYKRLDGKLVEETSYTQIAAWNFDEGHFIPFDYEWH